jgi:GrpB-like predicted nucleotidyltransferase (UPF0157 family)
MAIGLFPYDPDWLQQADMLIENLACILGSQATDFHHVGSTSIPGIVAKPKLHIDVILAPGLVPHTLGELLCPYGYVNLGYLHRHDELQLTRPFGKGRAGNARPIMAHRVCLCREDSMATNERLRFRDALRQNPHLALQYEHLKLDLAAHFGPISDWEGYNSGKTTFISSILRNDSSK